MNLNRRDAVASHRWRPRRQSPAFAQDSWRSHHVPSSFPQPTDNPGKIEVLEFFSYGCPPTRGVLHAPLGAWVAHRSRRRRHPQGARITFGRAAWTTWHACTTRWRSPGTAPGFDGEVFKAIHVERINLFDERPPSMNGRQEGRRSCKKFNEVQFFWRPKPGQVRRPTAQTYRIQVFLPGHRWTLSDSAKCTGLSTPTVSSPRSVLRRRSRLGRGRGKVRRHPWL